MILSQLSCLLQSCVIYSYLQRKYVTLAHICASVAHFLFSLYKKEQLCSRFNTIQQNDFMTKAEVEKKKSIGRSLYLSGMEQTEIADQLGVSRVTVSKWCTTEGWKEARAAKNISRPELVNKLLLTIDGLIENVNKSDDPTVIGSLADKLSKLSATIEKLDKKANVIDAIEVFMAFNRWIQDQASFDPDITPELVKAINKYQNKFLMERMQNPSSL
nr:MAG TPA: hypothetical protein [Caudoviricetes sp.]DAX48829.1 MAG TPA: hypothetical protein [Caudoviricetes sp.]